MGPQPQQPVVGAAVADLPEPAGVLERACELATLRQAMARADDGAGSVVFVVGEPGVGKTTVLRAFAADATAGAHVWFGACDDLITPRPLAPFGEMLDGLVGSVPTDRDAMIDRLMARVRSAGRPVAMLVDDAHWADDATLDVVRYLGRRVSTLPLVLVVALRPDGLAADHPLLRVIGRLTGAATRRIELRPLGRASVAQLAGRAGLDGDALFAETGGNPFLLSERLRFPDVDVPVPVRDAVLARLERLDRATRELVDLVSQLPEGGSPALLAGLVADLDEGLDAAEQAGVLVFHRDAVRFRHELARRAVDVALGAARRVQLNRLLLERLLAADADAHRLLHHAELAGDRDAVAAHAPRAVEEAARAGADQTTERLALLALEHADLLDVATQAQLWTHAARAAYRRNRFGDAVERAERAVALRERIGHPRMLGRALLLASRMHSMVQDPDAARAAATRAVEVLAPLGPSAGLAMAYSTLGNLDAVAGRDVTAVIWCDRAIALAQDVAAAEVVPHARNYLGISRLGRGEQGGLDDLRRAVTEAEQLGHTEYAFRAAVNLGAALLWWGCVDEARAPIEVAVEIARDVDRRWAVFHGVSQRAHVDLLQGRWDGLADTLETLLASSDDPVGVLVLPLSVLARLRLRLGAGDPAPLIEQAWRLATSGARTSYRIASAGLARIEHAWHTGSDADVVAIGEELLAAVRSRGTPYFEGVVRRHLVRVGVDVGSFDGCPPALDAGIRGDVVEAARRWDAMGAGHHAALELVASSDRATAVRGLARLDELGAAGTAARVRRDLRARGWAGVPRGPRPATREHPAGLTPRQVDVLVELATGKTSIEIGDVLHLSSRTVDNHVAAIVRKLGADGRRHAVELAIAEQLVERAAGPT